MKICLQDRVTDPLSRWDSNLGPQDPGANDGRSVSAHLTILLTPTLSFCIRCIFRKTFKELECDAVEKLDFSDSAKAVLSIFSF